MNFDQIISRTNKVFGYKSDKFLAQHLGISQQNFSNRKKKGTLLPEVIIEVCKLHPEVNLHWLITGFGRMYISDESFDQESMISPGSVPEHGQKIIHIDSGRRMAQMFMDKTGIPLDEEGQE